VRHGSSSEFSPAAILAASITLAARIAGVVATYGFFILLSRVHGAGAFGQFVVATTAVQLLATVARVGLDFGVMRVAGHHLAANDEAGANESIELAISIAFAAGVALTLLALPLLRIDSAYAASLRGPRIAILFALPVIAAAQVMYAALRAKHHAARASMAEGIVRPVCAFLLAVAAALWWPEEQGFAVAFLGAWIVAAIVAASFLRWRIRIATTDMRPLFAAAFPMLGVTLLQQNNAALDVLALPLVVPPDVVGHYAAAQKITHAVLMVYMAITAVFAPQVPAFASDRQALGTFYRSTTRWILIGTLPALIVTAALPELPLSFFGPEFVRNGALPLTLLSIAVLVHLVVGPVVFLLMMAARPTVLLWPYAIAFVVTVAALAALVPRYGPVGAASAMIVSSVVLRGLLYRTADRELGIRIRDGRCMLLIAGAIVIAAGAKLLAIAAGVYVAAAAALLLFAALAGAVIASMPLRVRRPAGEVR
jgi:O-antigen/teichoic acid export membrane protein